MLWRIADAVTDDVEDDEAGSWATALQQHFHILAPDRKMVWSKLCVMMVMVCFKNLDKSLAKKHNSVIRCDSVIVLKKKKSW